MFSLLPPTRAHTFILIFTKPPSSPFPSTYTSRTQNNEWRLSIWATVD